jgi:hypothetical protein
MPAVMTTLCLFLVIRNPEEENKEWDGGFKDLSFATCLVKNDL